MKFGKIAALVVFLIGIGLTLYSYYTPQQNEEAKQIIEPIDTVEVIEPTIEFGLMLDSFIVHKGKIKPNQFLADILLPHHVPYNEIDLLVKKARDIFDVRKIAANRPYTILCKKDSIEKASYFIYQPNKTKYVVYDLRDTMRVYVGRKEIDIKQKLVSGEIEHSLYVALQKQDISPALAIELSEIYAWSIDFYRIQKGDSFTVLYDELYVGDEFAGIGTIHASVFNHWGDDYHAYNFTQDSIDDYFDKNGKSLRKAFLQMPLKFGRLTSSYTLKRFHPVQKRWKAHLGTDYAAPKGTPILAVGDGEVIASSYGGGNGNFVKIKHNGTYTTQYLHMSKRAAKKGDKVKQGDVIGYVGSTGLATGPHVCFRFWKNGKQVNHRKEKLPPSFPIKKEYEEEFFQLRDSLQNIVQSGTAIQKQEVAS